MDISDASGSCIQTKLGELRIIRLLGKGKSGYSYLAQHNGQSYVVKLMHDEPCPYYSFGDMSKVRLETSAYHTLKETGIRMPALLDVNEERGFLVKEYIDGTLVTDLIIHHRLPDNCIEQVFRMSHMLQSIGFNIDYFPDNFVFSQEQLYYIDYEFNLYDETWDLMHWGLFYWANAKGMQLYKETHDPLWINESVGSGVPIRAPFYHIIDKWSEQFSEKRTSKTDG